MMDGSTSHWGYRSGSMGALPSASRDGRGFFIAIDAGYKWSLESALFFLGPSVWRGVMEHLAKTMGLWCSKLWMGFQQFLTNPRVLWCGQSKHLGLLDLESRTQIQSLWISKPKSNTLNYSCFRTINLECVCYVWPIYPPLYRWTYSTESGNSGTSFRPWFVAALLQVVSRKSSLYNLGCSSITFWRVLFRA